MINYNLARQLDKHRQGQRSHSAHPFYRENTAMIDSNSNLASKFTSCIGRLSVSRKLLLIYLLDLTAVIFITSILIQEKFINIDFARKELRGNAYIADVREVLFSAVAMHDRRHTAALAPVRGLIAEAEQKYGAGMGTAGLANDLISAINAIPTNDGASDIAILRSFRAGRSLLSRIGDQSNLILDPDLDSYYTMSLTVLRFPELLEQLMTYEPARRDKDKTRSLIDREKLEEIQKAVESDYRLAYAGNASGVLPHKLDHTREHLNTALLKLLQADPNERKKNTVLREAALAATHNAWQATESTLTGLLNDRIRMQFHRMWMHLGMAAALLIVILLMVFYVARQISKPLKRLATVADQIQTTNNYNLRAEWDSGDEIGQLVRVFNNMLEQLDRERLIQQELAAQARAASAQKELLDAIPIPLLLTTIPQHNILHANAPAGAWVDPGQGDPWGTGLERGARARFFQRLADLGVAHEFEAHWNGPQEGSWALLSATRLHYQGQEAVLTAFTPINTIKRMESRLKLWATIFEATSEGIIVFDRNNTIQLANSAIVRATGYHVDELVGHKPDFLYAKCSIDDYERNLVQHVAKHGSYQGEFWLKRENGEEKPYWVVVNTVRDENGEPANTIALYADISERKAQEEKIRHLAHHDPLTGLPNRLLFDERLRISLQQANRHHELVALLYIDLDRFKNINDSLGHHIGDGLLQSVAQRLLESVRVGDTVCRQGGDEFVVILHSVANAQEVANIIEKRLLPLILKPHSICDVTLHTSCSIGISIYPNDADSIEALMRNADAAMYSAKSGGRNNFQFFNEEMNRNAIERLNIENNLQHALKNQEFELHVQPIVDISSGRVVSVEALIRWRQPSLGLIPPAKFIPIAEESGMIHDIGRWALSEACRLHKHWAELGLGSLPIAVNISTVQFRRSNFVTTVKDVLNECGMSASNLQLELTESVMMVENDRTIEDIQQLKTLGVTLALDDFGTGYSSLSYLHRIPLDKLKIDRSFVKDMIDDPADMAITHAIINLGKTLGLRVVAEGVEHIEELKILNELRCEEAQGYLVTKPLPGHAFVSWYKDFISTPWPPVDYS